MFALFTYASQFDNYAPRFRAIRKTPEAALARLKELAEAAREIHQNSPLYSVYDEESPDGRHTYPEPGRFRVEPITQEQLSTVIATDGEWFPDAVVGYAVMDNNPDCPIAEACYLQRVEDRD